MFPVSGKYGRGVMFSFSSLVSASSIQWGKSDSGVKSRLWFFSRCSTNTLIFQHTEWPTSPDAATRCSNRDGAPVRSQRRRPARRCRRQHQKEVSSSRMWYHTENGRHWTWETKDDCSLPPHDCGTSRQEPRLQPKNENHRPRTTCDVHNKFKFRKEGALHKDWRLGDFLRGCLHLYTWEGQGCELKTKGDKQLWSVCGKSNFFVTWLWMRGDLKVQTWGLLGIAVLLCCE